MKIVTDDDDLMITTKNGIMIRMDMSSLRVMGRATQGVRVINLKSGVVIASVAKVPHSDEEEEEGPVVLDSEPTTESGNEDNSETNNIES
jgi:DNA gyrase subunit A